MRSRHRPMSNFRRGLLCTLDVRAGEAVVRRGNKKFTLLVSRVSAFSDLYWGASGFAGLEMDVRYQRVWIEARNHKCRPNNDQASGLKALFDTELKDLLPSSSRTDKAMVFGSKLVDLLLQKAQLAAVPMPEFKASWMEELKFILEKVRQSLHQLNTKRYEDTVPDVQKIEENKSRAEFLQMVILHLTATLRQGELFADFITRLETCYQGHYTASAWL
mmetsp:Transcript_46178/g.79674  ORF Transcript_46178/g.79674 Transcript_46178/m.79674 type:complete len:218 (-) Transcript_46178:1344-1997(-)